MARLLAQSLILARPAPVTATNPGSLLPLRGLATKVEVIVSDDDASAPAAAAGGYPSAQVMEIRRLEDALHGVMVRRATPDWLPFVPGGSFWMPPMRRPHEVAELIGRISAFGEEENDDADEAEAYAHMTEEEARSFSTVRGWPSVAYFVEGTSEKQSHWIFILKVHAAALDKSQAGERPVFNSLADLGLWNQIDNILNPSVTGYTEPWLLKDYARNHNYCALLEAARKAKFQDILSRISAGFLSNSWEKPLLLAWGEDDKYLLLSIAEDFKRNNPAVVKLHTIEGAGHMPQENWREKVAAALTSFLY